MSYWMGWFVGGRRAGKRFAYWRELADMNSKACREELADLKTANPDDAYWFARLAAHFAQLTTP